MYVFCYINCDNSGNCLKGQNVRLGIILSLQIVSNKQMIGRIIGIPRLKIVEQPPMLKVFLK